MENRIDNKYADINVPERFKFFSGIATLFFLFVVLPFLYKPFSISTYLWVICFFGFLIFLVIQFFKRLKLPTVFVINQTYLIIDFKHQPSIHLPYSEILFLQLSGSINEGRLHIQTSSKKQYLLVGRFEGIYGFFQKLADISQIVVPSVSYEELAICYKLYAKEVNKSSFVLPLFAFIDLSLFCYFCAHNFRSNFKILFITLVIIEAVIMSLILNRRKMIHEKYIKLNILHTKFSKI